ncbi:MAG: aminotransferase class V-fold PLP-dependent enzyme [Verrucomicrobiales bacterium]|nr:aminotransferase class V-fold PLP-dependent enzyme [Verrucomicrobiales bacterium]MCP5526167.1 aminotransferase class V-fold PLP-dependent enzyme [Verrucomicrobiales bacterium]
MALGGAARVREISAVRYFDHNATHPLSAAARTAWLAAVARFPANPSSPHRWGARAEAALHDARLAVAAWLDAPPLDIVWTSGATEAANMLMHSAARQGSGEAWVSAIEHPCVIAAARRWFGNRVRQIPATPEGVVDLNWLDHRIRRAHPDLVAIMAANNETGVLQPWPAALAWCREHGVAFACDAAQWIGRLPAQGLGGADYVFGCAHKFGGPLGVGFMKAPGTFHPLLVGGPQEDGRRAGTENVAGILAMRAAWEEREQAMREGAVMRLEPHRDAFIGQLKERLPGGAILGEGCPRLWNTVAALMPPVVDCRRRWVVQLDRLGFAVSTGSACASGKEQPSHVLRAMGVPDATADRVLRFSAGWETGAADWQALLDAVLTAAREMAR